jgi:hypothetical protein
MLFFLSLQSLASSCLELISSPQESHSYVLKSIPAAHPLAHQYTHPLNNLFTSGITGLETVYSGDIFLGSSKAEVYYNISERYIVKIYPSNSTWAAREIMALRFIKERGGKAPRVLDYSDNIARNDGRPKIIIKDFIEGPTLSEAVRTLQDLDLDAVNQEVKNYEEMFEEFHSWMRQHPEGQYYLSIANVFKRAVVPVDISTENFIVSDGELFFIDP